MAFPSSPTNGQTATQNGITYTYASATNSWARTLGSIANLTVSGNITSGNANLGNLVTASYFTGNGSLLTGLPASYANSNVASYLPTYTGNITAGNVNVGTAVVASTLTSNVATGTAPLTVTSTTRVTNLNVSYSNVSDYDSVTTTTTGTFYPTFVNGSTSANYQTYSNTALSFNAATGNLSATLLTGTLTTAAQPNITSTGTLASLSVTANVSAGNLLTNNLLYANGTAWSLGGGGTTITADNTTNSNSYYPIFTTTTTGSMSGANVANTKLYFNPSTGTLNSTIFNSLSDETIKTNKERIINALSKLLTLGGYTYLMIDSNEPSAGLLAQEVQKVLPEAVKYNTETGLLSLNYNAVLGMVVEAINELEQRVTGLENGK